MDNILLKRLERGDGHYSVGCQKSMNKVDTENSPRLRASPAVSTCATACQTMPTIAPLI